MGANQSSVPFEIDDIYNIFYMRMFKESVFWMYMIIIPAKNVTKSI